MKKIISIFISVLVLTTSVQAAINSSIVGTPQTTNSEDLITCQFKESSDYYPVGDTRGGSILTREEVIRDCNITTTVQGECIRWDKSEKVEAVPQEAYNTFDTNDYSDTVGTLFSTIGAYDQLEHIWSGYQGYCISGIEQDFSWLSDPMFWSSMVMSYLMSNAQITKPDDAGTLTGGVQSMNQSVGKMALSVTGQTITDKAANALGSCLVSGGVDMTMAAVNFFQDGTSSDQECNPIDEICHEDNPTSNTQTEIRTIDVQMFQDLVDQYSADGENLYDYVEVIDDGSTTGVVAYRMKASYETPDYKKDNLASQKELIDKMKQIQLTINLAVTAGKMASCIGTGGAVGSTSGTTAPGSDQRASIKNGLFAGADFAGKFLGPYGPAAAAAMKLIMAFATSFSPIDTCHDKDDADLKGSRHAATYKSLKYNLCHPTYDECVDEYVWGGCCLDGYHYCCYDQLMTKILVIQLKAQLGRGYSNCTGISLKDLNNVSFRQCTEAEMKNGIDGASAYGIGYDATKSFQHINHCIDMTEFKNYLQDLIGENVDMDSFEDFWSDLSTKDPY